MTRALIVDDKPENLHLLRAILESHGFEVEDARHGAEALAMARQHPPDLVITDLLMPVMDGYTLLRHWRADDRLNAIPFIVYTATYTDPQDEKLALDLGADAFIVKPVELDPFMARVREVLEQARTRGAAPTRPPWDEPVALRQYNDVLVRRLEEKRVELDQLNRVLTDREARLRAIIEAEPECVKLVAADGTLLEVNPAGLRIFEADSFQQVENQDICGLIDEEHRAAFRDLTERVFRGESGTLEFQIIGLKGGRRWLETHASPLRDATGAVTALLGITRDITERKLAEQQLTEKTLLLAESQRIGHIGTWSLELPDNYLRWSDETYRIFQVPHTFVLTAASFLDLVHPHDRAGTREWIRACELGEEPGELECRVVLPDGGIRILSGRGEFLPATDFAPNRVLGTVQDVTERKQAEDELRVREDRHLRQRNALVDLTSSKPVYRDGLASVLGKITECAANTLGVARAGIWRYNEDHTAIHCVDLYELEADRHSSGAELSGASHPAYFRALDEAEVIAADDACRDSRTSEFADSYLRPLGITSMVDAPLHVGGALEGVLCHEHVGPARRWTQDEKVFAVAIANLVSLALEGWERHRAETDLREAQNRLQLAVSSGKVGLWDWDLRTNKARFSPEWKSQIGYRDDEISDDFGEWQSRVHPDDLDRALQRVQAYLSADDPDYESEFRFRHKSGSYRHILARASEVRGPDGTRIRLVGSHVDITAWTELQAQFLQSQKTESVGQLAGGIAHDFNNLLTVINGTADLVLSDLKAGDPLRADLLEIHDAGDRAASLTRQLLAFSRNQIMTPDVLDLNTVVSDMRSMLERLIGEHIKLVITPAKSLRAVKADQGQIEQVIMNLAVNARDAMPDGGALTIETQNVELDAAYASEHSAAVKPGPYVMLAVSDTGVGMDEPTRRRVFEPFFTTKGPGRGTGLGLSTAYGIVKQSGGSIWVYSEPGRGTTFKIHLPQLQESAHTERRARTAMPARGTETVLIVEDEAAVRHLAARVLQSAGYTVVAASNGAEALLLLERHDGPVHVMFTDVVMPGMTVRDLAAHVVSIRPEMKVLYTSGYTDDAILRHGVLEDPMRFIGKPYTREDLLRKVRDALDSPAPGR